jgi:hypothetical protein
MRGRAGRAAGVSSAIGNVRMMDGVVNLKMEKNLLDIDTCGGAMSCRPKTMV